jgi:hypothetical protein
MERIARNFPMSDNLNKGVASDMGRGGIGMEWLTNKVSACEGIRY